MSLLMFIKLVVATLVNGTLLCLLLLAPAAYITLRVRGKLPFKTFSQNFTHIFATFAGLGVVVFLVPFLLIPMMVFFLGAIMAGGTASVIGASFLVVMYIALELGIFWLYYIQTAKHLEFKSAEHIVFVFFVSTLFVALIPLVALVLMLESMAFVPVRDIIPLFGAITSTASTAGYTAMVIQFIFLATMAAVVQVGLIAIPITTCYIALRTGNKLPETSLIGNAKAIFEAFSVIWVANYVVLIVGWRFAILASIIDPSGFASKLVLLACFAVMILFYVRVANDELDFAAREHIVFWSCNFGLWIGLSLLVYSIEWIVGIYIGLAAFVAIFQEKIIFVPKRDSAQTPEDLGWKFDEVALEVDGETTHGWYVRAEEKPKAVILFSYGKSGNMAEHLPAVESLRSLGCDVLTYDYGGYGISTGRPSETRMYKDIRGMWTYLTEKRKVPANRIFLFGRALGAAPTIQLATEVGAGAAILESPFESIPKLARFVRRILPLRLIIRHKFENTSKIGRIKCPALIVHSPNDTVVPYAHARKLFDSAPEPKEFYDIHGNHGDGFWSTGEPYKNHVQRYLNLTLRKSMGT